ncbi:MAG: GNAT family N-acetyltransferase [Candidatus Ornithospirochaeta sp.]|nr:GNAT family N-acetyltransferase [Candidatus Ornithospirochaeta sp.]
MSSEIDRILSSDPFSHLDIVSILKNGEGEILYNGCNGIIVRHFTGTVFALPFTEDYEVLIGLFPSDEWLYCIHSVKMARYFAESRKMKFDGVSILYSYHGGKLDTGPYEYRTLDDSYFGFVKSHYSNFSSDEALQYDIEKGNLFGIFDHGIIMGFAGFHPEGSMGLLEVLPEFRGKGIGTYLESYVINRALENGKIPFCNVYTHNSNSIRLQNRIGMIRGRRNSAWVYI